MEELKKMLSRIEEDIRYHEDHDYTYTRYYDGLLKKRRLIQRTIKKLAHIESRYCGV